MSKPCGPSARKKEKQTRQSVRRDLRGLHSIVKDETQHETPEVVGDP